MIGSKPKDVATIQGDSGSTIEPWKQRVLDEKSELNDKIGKLAAFLSSEQFEALPKAEQDRLTRQLDAMTVYRSILTERITAWQTGVEMANAAIENPHITDPNPTMLETRPTIPDPGTV